MIAIDLSKQGACDADPRAIQQIYFTGNLDRTECALEKEVKKTLFDFLEETIKIL